MHVSMNLRDLFEAALALEPSARVAFLDQHCPDSATRSRLEQLLGADADADEPVSEKAFDRLARAIADSDAADTLPPGSRIGSFELVEVLGEGGSSTVFHALREVEGASQHVALKLLRQSLHSPEARRRFGREQRALIQLRHPNIARMIEGGVTDTGLPYIALELVGGTSITEHARERRLDLRQRLRLFVVVCAAVDAAHRALIVHRDLKPSNVLVTHEGDVKLLDFGVAKLLAEEDDGKRTVLPAFTPAYAAPEQRSGGAITTATDVYALGVLLGELVTGRRINDGSGRTPSRQVSDSTAPGVLPASAAATRRQVHGDLDAIVLKAIDVDPACRYASAGALGDDLERLLAGQPVSAHPPTRWYRARKFVLRHRGGVASTVAFLLATFAALGIAVWQANLARQEARRANAVREFVEGMFEPIRAGVAEGKQPSLAELVSKGAARIDATASLGDAERVDLLLMFARLHDYLSDPVQYQVLADRAGELADTRLGKRDPRALDALVARGAAALRRSDHVQGGARLSEAEQRYRAAGQRGEAWIRLLGALSQWAGDTGQPQRALDYAREALDARIAKYGADSVEAAGGYVNFGYGLEGVGRFDEAAHIYRRVHSIYATRFGTDNERAIAMRGRIGQAELMTGHLRLARDELRATLAALPAPQGKASASQVKLSQSLCLAESFVAPATVADACARAVAFAEQAEGKEGSNVGRALHTQGAMLIEQGDLRAARDVLERARDLLARANRPNWQGRAEIALGEIALVEGDPARAVPALLAGIEHVGASYPPYLGAYGRALVELACTIDGATQGCATVTRGGAQASLTAQSARWSPLLLSANIALARIDIAHARTAEALARLGTAITHAQPEIGPGSPRHIEAQLWRVAAYANAGECASARHAAEDVPRAPDARLDHPLVQAAIRAAQVRTHCGPLID